MSLVNSRMVRGRCPMCGAAHAACGAASDSTPVDERMEVAAVGGPLKRYEVTTPSGVKTTMKLNEADAERLGVLNDSSGEQTDSAPAEDEQPAVSATAKATRSTRNKARTASDKGDG